MAIKYPVDCDSPRRKTEYLYAAQELLRYIQNLMAYWYREGITRVQYDNPPLLNVPSALQPVVHRIFTYLKNKYPFTPKLSQEAWDRFYREDFEPRSNKIIAQIGIQRAQLKASVAWEVRVEDI